MVAIPVTFRFRPLNSSILMSPPMLTLPVTVRTPTVAIPVANISPSGLNVIPDPTRISFWKVEMPVTFNLSVMIFSVDAEPTTVVIPVVN